MMENNDPFFSQLNDWVQEGDQALKRIFGRYIKGTFLIKMKYLVTQKFPDFIKYYTDIQSGKQGRFRLNRKALIVTLKTGEEIIFAVADKHKKWFALMDEKVNV